jgi:hypothetical protein
MRLLKDRHKDTTTTSRMKDGKAQHFLSRYT